MHLLRVQGFCFALLQYSHIQAFTAPFMLSMQLYRPRRKTAHGALQGLFLQFAVFLRLLSGGAFGYAVQPARRWRAYQRTKRLYQYQIPPPRRTLYRAAQPPYYNKVYIRVQRRAPLLWIYARQRNTSQTMTARQLEIWHRSAVRTHQLAYSTRRGSPAAGARRAARNH